MDTQQKDVRWRQFASAHCNLCVKCLTLASVDAWHGQTESAGMQQPLRDNQRNCLKSLRAACMSTQSRPAFQGHNDSAPQVSTCMPAIARMGCTCHGGRVPACHPCPCPCPGLCVYCCPCPSPCPCDRDCDCLCSDPCGRHDAGHLCLRCVHGHALCQHTAQHSMTSLLAARYPHQCTDQTCL